MRFVVVLAVITNAHRASAEPIRPTFAAYGGFAEITGLTTIDDTSLGLGEAPSAAGVGVWTDAEAGVRADQFSAMGFAGIVRSPTRDTYGSTGHVSCYGNDTIDEELLEAGVRARWRFENGLSLGGGVGAVRRLKRVQCIDTMAHVDSQENSVLLEFEVGVPVHRIGSVEVQ